MRHGAAAQDAIPKAPRTLAELEARLEAALKKGDTPGAAVAIVEDNKVVLTKHFGYRDLKTKAPVTDETIFRAGSITKSFTGLLAMTMVEEGKLSLDARLANVAPDIGFDNPWEATAPLRIVHLMEHTTGWHDLRFPDIVRLHPQDEVGRDIAVSRRLRVSRWQPGRYMAYSNVGPGVMGVILERLGGAPYAEQMRSRILAPIGMNRTDFALTGDMSANLSKSYDVDGKTEIPYHGIGVAAAGSMLTTASDLAKFVIFMNDRGKTQQGAQIVTPESVARMERPQSTLAAKAGLTYGYGLGVFYAPQTNFIVYGHNGGIDGFESAYVYWPEQRKGYVLLVNGGRANGDALELITLYLGRDFKAAPNPAEVKPGPEFAPYAGYYHAVAQRHAFMNALVGLYPNEISLGPNGRVNALGAERIGVGGNKFRRDDRPDATMIFYTTPEGQREFSTGREVMRQFTQTELALLAAMLAGAALASALALLSLLTRLVRMLVPSWRRSTGALAATMRWAPTFSVLSLLTMLGVFLIVANAGYQAVEMLGRPNAATYAIYGASFAWPAFAALGLVLSITNTGSTKPSRAAAFLISLGMLGLATHFLANGWIGIRFWE
jgi:CubicO group peptidase (beta-lactamase class C family)